MATFPKDSYASRYQRDNYGGEIPSYSTFSDFQSSATIGGSTEEHAKVPVYACMLGWVALFLAVRAMYL
jgi:hypothetical protein